MELSEVRYEGQLPVDSYGPGFFRVGGQLIDGGLLVSPKGAQVWGGLAEWDAIFALADEMDILFVGMGAEIAHLPGDVRDKLDEAGIAAEVMSSPSACRTYNVLLSEGRRVILAALPV